MKKHKHKGKHRNAGPPRPAVPRAVPRKPPPPESHGMGVGEIGALVVASAATAGLGALAARTNNTVGNVATAMMGTAGAIGALRGDGVVRAVSAGVLGACAGHVTTQLMPKPAPKAARDDKDHAEHPPPERRQAALPPPSEPDLAPSLREELARAHAAVAALYPDDYDAQRFAA